MKHGKGIEGGGTPAPAIGKNNLQKRAQPKSPTDGGKFGTTGYIDTSTNPGVEGGEKKVGSQLETGGIYVGPGAKGEKTYNLV